MECRQHPGVSATAACTRCDAFLCPDCVCERRGKAFCGDCAAFIDRRMGGAEAPPSAAAPAGTPGGGGLYQPPHAPVDARPEPTDAGAAAPADLFGSPPEIYKGPPPTAGASGGGDLYEPPRPPSADGDLYEPPPPPAADTPSSASEAEATGASNLVATLAVAAVLVALGAGIWLGVTVLTEHQFALVSILIGAVCGIGMRAILKLPGTMGGLAALGVYAAAIFGGEALVDRHYAGVLRDEMQSSLDVSRSAWTIALDGSYTDDEVRRLYGISDSDWQEMSQLERQDVRSEVMEADSSGELADWVNVENLENVAGLLEEARAVSVGGVLGGLGVIGWLIVAFGGAEAYKIGHG